jgi:hypothetical protein
MLAGYIRGLGSFMMIEFQNANLSAFLRAALLFLALSLMADLIFRAIYSFAQSRVIAK